MDNEQQTSETMTAEQIAQHISAMGDSVALINKDIAKEFSEKIGSRVNRNVRHLSNMLTKDFIIADSGDKDIFIEAIAAGQAYLDANK